MVITIGDGHETGIAMRRGNRMRQWAAAAVSTTLAMTLLVACSQDSDTPDPKSPGTNGQSPRSGLTKPGRPAFDPPMRFEGPGIELMAARQPSTTSGGASRPAVTLANGVAYITAEEGIEAIDTQTGEPRWEARTKNADDKGDSSSRTSPLVSADGKTVYAAWNRWVKGEGTAPGRAVIEVLAVDTATGKTAWSVEVPAAPSSTGLAASPIGAAEILAPQVIGVDATTAVVTAADTTYAVDPVAGTVRWKKADFLAVVLADGVVAGGERTGFREGRLTGVSVASGDERWTISDAKRPARVGPGLLTAVLGAKTLVVDAAKGEQRLALDGGWGCLHDKQSLVLCSGSAGSAGSGRGIAVFDAASLEKRWALPDGSGRNVPRVSGFWHGAVYGEVVEDEGLVLDGMTGQDRETSAGVAPTEIDQFGGVSFGTGRPTFYRATR
ncbi:PQQ-binding-like beta-propeller repeat protein [Streptomyces sp. NRRL S-237]|uniref:outer membrane protein assembly factor BamB family protein n=1 Tax=Streptomyces sp. NRRL S-237 TaxID=1463895 RepID=UPI001F4745E8|nr:PQQ-binding-like beta-propeller repeat protein [Streptomyces sp. NRRL S-237]